MRIGLVIPSVPAYSETFFSNKIKGLEENGFSVVLFVNNPDNGAITSLNVLYAPRLNGNLITKGVVSTFYLFRSLLLRFRQSRQLYMLDKADAIGIVQRVKNIISNSHILSESVDWLHFGFGTMVFNRENVAEAIGAKMAVSFRGFDIGIYPLKNPDCYQGLWKKVDKIHVISDDIKDQLYVNGFRDQTKVFKITPAIDTNKFRCEMRNFSMDESKIVTIARLHWKKGLEHSLEALALLKKEGIYFHYTIIGTGEEYERLKFAAYQLGVENQVTFTGKITHDKVKEELSAADIYLQYSIQEGFCNAVLEAQSMGLLSIVSDAEGLSENVIDNETGWVVQRSDTGKLAKKLMEVMHLNILEKERISMNAQKRVSEHFSIEKQNSEFFHFYSS